MKPSFLKPSRTPIARKPLKKRPRKKSETLRIYGPPARRVWMKTLPCSACSVVGYSEGAHVLGNGGTGRKADYDTQAPLCGPRADATDPWSWDGTTYIGCHKLFDDYRWRFSARFPDFDPAKVARETEEMWASSVLGRDKSKHVNPEGS